MTLGVVTLTPWRQLYLSCTMTLLSSCGFDPLTRIESWLVATAWSVLGVSGTPGTRTRTSMMASTCTDRPAEKLILRVCSVLSEMLDLSELLHQGTSVTTTWNQETKPNHLPKRSTTVLHKIQTGRMILISERRKFLWTKKELPSILFLPPTVSQDSTNL